MLDLLSLFLTPNSIIIFVIMLALGAGLGYFSIKALKYVVALIGIFVVGVLLNVWQAPQVALDLGHTVDTVVSVIMPFIYLVGLTTVLPITLGFVIGLVIAVVK